MPPFTQPLPAPPPKQTNSKRSKPLQHGLDQTQPNRIPLEPAAARWPTSCRRAGPRRCSWRTSTLGGDTRWRRRYARRVRGWEPERVFCSLPPRACRPPSLPPLPTLHVSLTHIHTTRTHIHTHFGYSASRTSSQVGGGGASSSGGVGRKAGLSSDADGVRTGAASASQWQRLKLSGHSQQSCTSITQGLHFHPATSPQSPPTTGCTLDTPATSRQATPCRPRACCLTRAATSLSTPRS